MQNNTVMGMLAGDEPFPAYKKDLMLYGQLVGSWSVRSTWYDRNGEIRKKRGEWHFGWVLGGRGIQDVLFAEGAAPDQYGTTLRCYDPGLKIWHVSWMQPYGGEFVHLIGRKVGNSIVQEGGGSDPARRERWTFRDITANSFLWLGEVSLDGGESWFLEQEMRGMRMG